MVATSIDRMMHAHLQNFHPGSSEVNFNSCALWTPMSLAWRDLKWLVWHCRNTVAYDVSDDNG